MSPREEQVRSQTPWLMHVEFDIYEISRRPALAWAFFPLGLSLPFAINYSTHFVVTEIE